MNRATARADAASRFPDYLASCILSCAAVQGFASSMQIEAAGMALMLMLIFGTALSFFVRSMGAGTKLMEWGPWISAVFAVAGWAFPAPIGRFVPSEEMYGQLFVGAHIAGLLVYRSVALWTDGDVLFQAVPAMALFGLAATYPSEGRLALFFVLFLVCLAYMLARQHTRSMVEVAAASGVPESRARLSVAGAGTPRLALFGVGFVVVLSLLVSPLLQIAIQKLATPLLTFGAGRMASTSTAEVLDPDDEIDIGVGGHSSTNVVVLIVEADRPLYLRERVYASFTGSSWKSANPYPWRARPELDADGGILFDLRDGQPGTLRGREGVAHTVRIQTGLHSWLFAAADPVLVRDLAGTLPHRGSLEYAPEIGIRCPNLSSGAEYAVYSLVPEDRPSVLRRTDAGGASRLYRQLPPDLSPELERLARRITAGTRTDYDRVEALRSHISQTCMYSLTEPPLTSNTDRVSEFLLERKKGYCDSFASALAILCRELGMPARVVRGWAPGDYNEETDTYLVREKHFHLWTEVHFRGIGWVIFDATEGAREVDPVAAMAEEGIGGFSFWHSPWPPLIIDTLVALVALYLIAAWWRGRRHASLGTGPRREALLLYAAFLRTLRRAGFRQRLPNETPGEHLAFVAAGLPGDLAQRAGTIIEGVNAALFRPEPGADLLRGLREGVEEWRRAMRGFRKGKT